MYLVANYTPEFDSFKERLLELAQVRSDSGTGKELSGGLILAQRGPLRFDLPPAESEPSRLRPDKVPTWPLQKCRFSRTPKCASANAPILWPR